MLRDTLNGWYDGTIGLNSPITNHEDREAKEAQFRTCIQWAFPDTSDEDMREYLSAIYSFQASQQEERVYGFFKSITKVSSYIVSPVLKPTQLDSLVDVAADDSSDATEIPHSPVQSAEEVVRHRRMITSIDTISETMMSMKSLPEDIEELLIANCRALSSDIGAVHTDTKETNALVQSLREEMRRMSSEVARLASEWVRTSNMLVAVRAEAKAAAKDAKKCEECP